MSINLKRSAYLVFTVVLIAIITYAFNQQKSQTREIKVGYLSIISATPLLVAMNEGLFQHHGITIKPVEFKSSNEIAIAAASGSIDVVAVGATSVMLETMISTKRQFKMFMANQYVKRPNLESSDFLLSNEGITSVEQLKGKKVAFFPGSAGHVFAKAILPKYGLSENDLVYIEMPPPQWLAALKSGAIDAVTALEPFSSQIMDSMKVNVLIDGYYAEVMPLVPASGAWFREGVLDASTEKEFVKVFRDAIQIIETDRTKTLAALEKYTGLSSATLQKTRLLKWSLMTDPVAKSNAIEFAELFVKYEGIKTTLPMDQWIWSAPN